VVVINEVVPKAIGDGPDWVELLNVGDAAVDLTGWGLSDDAEQPMQFTFPEGTALEPGAYLVLEGPDSAEEVHFDFGLGRDDSLALVDAAGEAVDATAWTDGDAPEGMSWARIPNGQGDFATTAPPTPGAENQELVWDSEVVLNELVAQDADGGPDWVELYNRGLQALALDGWGLSDDPAQPFQFTFPEGSVIEPTGFVVVLGPDSDADVSFDFGLGGDDVLLLTAPGGQLADRVAWTDEDLAEGASYGRAQNGEGDFVALSPATPGASNE